MDTAALLLLVAVSSSAQCGPLGQTTVCESAQGAPALLEPLPGALAAILPYLYGFPGAFAPSLLNGVGLPYGLPYPSVSSETVCESTPGVVGLGTAGGLGWGNYPIGLPLGINFGCPNIGALGSACPLGGQCTSTVCESSPNVLGLGPYGFPLNGLPLGGLPLGGLPLNGLPLNGLPLNGLPLNGLGLGLGQTIPFL